MKKIYKLNFSVFVLMLVVFSETTYSQATYTFNYTGSIQTFTAAPGSYSIEMWGADGGSSGQSRAGIGGYSKGTLNLSTTTTLYIGVGGTPVYTGVTGLQPGGYNGGGSGYANASGRAGAGATHIATAPGILSSLVSNTSAVIIVAGGGGGDQNAGVIGHGGGSSGGGTYPGTQTGSGGSAVALFGTFGQGGDITTSYGGGGGGGWYGGGGNQNNAGSGGSGYIGGVTSAITTMSGTPGFVTKPVVTGNGLVILKELCNITLVASTANSLNPVICSGQSLTLTTNAVSNYAWSTGATTSSLVVSPTISTVYSLTATSPSNCTASANISVTVSNAQPTLSVVSSTNQTCLGKTATLTASGAVTYTWTNGVTNGVSFFPTTTTTYTVTGQNGCGITTAVSTISVSPLAATAVTSSSAVCTNKTATLSVTAAATSYTWNPGNITGTSPNLIVNPQTNTDYTITVSDGTCSGVANVSVVANPVPTINAVSTVSTVCPGGTVGLSATGGINYTWTPVNMNGASITATPQASTLFNVTGDNSFGCLNNASQVVVVGTQPTVVLSSSSPSICGGSSATLTASGADTYAWLGGPTTATYVVSPSGSTTYSATGTNTTSGCSDTKTFDIGVFTPTLTVSGASVVCEGGQVNLTASGANTYTWNPGGLQFGGITVNPPVTTTYTVDGIANQGILNCPGSTTFQLLVNPNPTVTTTSVKPAICAKETNTYTASGASTYTWTSNAGTVVGPSITVTSSITTILAYTVSGTNAQGCVDEESITASIFACTGLEQATTNSERLTIYPNPNNGEFTIEATSEMNLSLINELGQLVKQIHLGSGNTQKAVISDLPNGVYFISGDKVKQKIVVNK